MAERIIRGFQGLQRVEHDYTVLTAEVWLIEVGEALEVPAKPSWEFACYKALILGNCLIYFVK